MLIDTHCHLDFPQFDNDRDVVIKRAKDNKVSYLINVGSSVESSFRSAELSSQFDNIFFSAGIHPHGADKVKDNDFSKLTDLTSRKKLAAIGEVGLDYYRNLSGKDNQKEVFIKFIEFAQKLNLPLIIHSRESASDTYQILKDRFSDFSKIVLHCFSGADEFLDKYIELKAMFSFTANITYPKAAQLRELIKKIPKEQIMLETDCPYLPPQKYRGQRNEPSYIHLTAQELASVKNISFDEIANITTQNAKRFFKLEI